MVFPLRLVFLALLTCLSAMAADDELELPLPLDASFADGLVAHSPFTRMVNLKASLQLAGIAFVDGRPLATIVNKETQVRFLISETPNEQGWRLVTANAGEDPHQAKVELSIGGELVVLHYSEPQMFPVQNRQDSVHIRLAASDRKNSDTLLAAGLATAKSAGSPPFLSPEARQKFQDMMASRLQKHPQLTPEQTANYARKVLTKLQPADDSWTGGFKPPKAAKVPKKKQGV